MPELSFDQVFRPFTRTLLLCLLLLLTSCGDESTRPCPVHDIGAVEGYVIAGGEGSPATVRAVALCDPRREVVVATVESDSTGWYRLELPTARYRLETAPVSSVRFSSDVRDTITITPRVHRRDLLRGRVRIQVRMPADLEGEQYRLSLGYPYSRSYLAESGHVTDGLLDFHFPMVPAGPYGMRIWSGSNPMSLYLPGSHDPEWAEMLEVGVEALTEYEISFEESHGSISGSVTGSWQQVAGGPPSVLAYCADSTMIGRTACREDGAFTLSMFLAQPVRLLTRIEGVERWVEGDSYEEARIFTVRPGDRLAGVSEVESGILVWLEGPGTSMRYQAGVRLINSSGGTIDLSPRWRNPIPVHNLPCGDYLLHVYGHCSGESWASQWYDGAESMDEATAIRLEPGELRVLDLHLVEGGGIQGRVYGPAGEPLDYCYARIHGADGEPLCAGWELVHGGEFSWRGLANGEYYLSAGIPRSSEIWWYPGEAEFDRAAPVRISDHETVTGVDWIAGGEGKVVL